MSKSTAMSTDTMLVKGNKQKSQIIQAMVEALYRFNPKALFGSPILFTLWLAAVMATVESLLGQPFSGLPLAGLAADRLALADSLVCQLRGNPGRGARQGPRRQPESWYEPAQGPPGGECQRWSG